MIAVVVADKTQYTYLLPMLKYLKQYHLYAHRRAKISGSIDFGSWDELIQKLRHYTKIVGIRLHEILGPVQGKIYSIGYMTDGIWNNTAENIKRTHRIYHYTKQTQNLMYRFAGIEPDPQRDRLLGNMAIRSVRPVKHTGIILFKEPSMHREEYKRAIGMEQWAAEKQLAGLFKNNRICLKKRRKYKSMKGLTNLAHEVFVDKTDYGCDTVISFCSSGVYEDVCDGMYVINVRRKFDADKNKLQIAFGDMYCCSGVVETTDIRNIRLGNKMDQEARQLWIEQYVGPVYHDSHIRIAKDIMEE